MAKRPNRGALPFGVRGRLGVFEEFALKQFEAKTRMAKVFAAFVRMPKMKTGGYYVCGGDVPPSSFSNSNFGGVVVGHSLVEAKQGMDLLRTVGSRVSSLYTGEDFHSTVALDFLSKYMRANIQNMKIPQALAVEFMMTDFVGNLFRVHFTGDIEIDKINETDEDIFIVGAYNEKFRQSIIAELKKAPNQKDKEQMEKFAKSLAGKFNLSHINFIL